MQLPCEGEDCRRRGRLHRGRLVRGGATALGLPARRVPHTAATGPAVLVPAVVGQRGRGGPPLGAGQRGRRASIAKRQTDVHGADAEDLVYRGEMARQRDEDKQSGGATSKGGEGAWEQEVAERGGRVEKFLVAFGGRWGEDKV